MSCITFMKGETFFEYELHVTDRILVRTLNTKLYYSSSNNSVCVAYSPPTFMCQIKYKEALQSVGLCER
jgi:hypothetical protein